MKIRIENCVFDKSGQRLRKIKFPDRTVDLKLIHCVESPHYFHNSDPGIECFQVYESKEGELFCETIILENDGSLSDEDRKIRRAVKVTKPVDFYEPMESEETDESEVPEEPKSISERESIEHGVDGVSIEFKDSPTDFNRRLVDNGFQKALINIGKNTSVLVHHHQELQSSWMGTSEYLVILVDEESDTYWKYTDYRQDIEGGHDHFDRATVTRPKILCRVYPRTVHRTVWEEK